MARNAAQGASKSYDVYLSLTKLLIAKGADPSVKLKSGSMIEDNEPHRAKAGETALHAVARSFSQKHASEVCELLLTNGAKVNEVNDKGQTPLDEALANERKQTAETLRQHGGKVGGELGLIEPCAFFHQPNDPTSFDFACPKAELPARCSSRRTLVNSP